MLFCTHTQVADVEIISQDDELTGIETFEKNKTLTQTVIKVIFSGGWLAALSKGHTEETAIQIPSSWCHMTHLSSVVTAGRFVFFGDREGL